MPDPKDLARDILSLEDTRARSIHRLLDAGDLGVPGVDASSAAEDANDTYREDIARKAITLAREVLWGDHAA